MKRIALTVLAAATVVAAIPAAASAQNTRGPIPYTQYRPSTPPVWLAGSEPVRNFTPA